jgi:hypothetical protein
MKTLKCKCEAQGLLLIGADYHKNEDGSVPCYESGIAHYEFNSPSDLYNVASEYRKIERANGKIEFGRHYTARKAKNDFEALAVERPLKVDVAGFRYTE